MEFDTDNIQQLAKEKIEIGSKLCADLANLIKVDGVQKVKRRIEQEIKFLRKVGQISMSIVNNIILLLQLFRLPPQDN